MKTGYHYTSYKNWLKIKKQGLLPMTCHQNSLEEYFPEGVMGCWVWQRDLKGNSHIGTIIHRLQARKTTRIVKLRVKYQCKDALHFKNRKVVFFHRGEVGGWLYHANEPAVIITAKIPPENIELVRDYNINQLFK